MGFGLCEQKWPIRMDETSMTPKVIYFKTRLQLERQPLSRHHQTVVGDMKHLVVLPVADAERFTIAADHLRVGGLVLALGSPRPQARSEQS